MKIKSKECQNPHRYNREFEQLPLDQGGAGRHRCAACAYDRGYIEGLALTERIDLDLESLPESQAGAVRHRSPHAAYALGYYDGVAEHYGSKSQTPSRR